MHETAAREPIDPLDISIKAGLVILLGFLLRVFSYYHTLVVNTDAIFYIQQAKALHYGLYDQIGAGYPYLTNYSIFIALSYNLFGDWVSAAMSVSLIFGTLTMVPLYWLVRRFFDENTTVLALLMFALSPPFINMSRDVLRGPVYWFFSVLGLYLFVLQMERERRVCLVLSCLSFLFAAWARIEALLFVFSSALYLIFSRTEGKWRRLAFFLVPVAMMGIIAAVDMVAFEQAELKLLASDRFFSRLSDLPANYQTVRGYLSELIEKQPPGGMTRYFFERVRNLVWFIALATLFVQITRAFYFPFFLVFACGVWAARPHIRRDPRLRYLSLLAGASVLLLYGQIIYLWAMFNRWIALFLFPTFVFLGFGVRQLGLWLEKRLEFKRMTAYGLICLAIFAVSLPVALRYYDRQDKLVFKQIGQYIAQREQADRPVTVAGTFKELILIDFYAHLRFRGAPAFDRDSIFQPSENGDIAWIRQKHFDYFIWDEKGMGRSGLAWIQAHADIFAPLGQWWSPKLGKLILYEIRG